MLWRSGSMWSMHAQRLGKAAIPASQASVCGGSLDGTMHGERLTLAGQAALYSAAKLHL